MLLNSMTDIDRIEEYEGCDDGSNGNGGAGFRPLGKRKKEESANSRNSAGIAVTKNQTRQMREIQNNCRK